MRNIVRELLGADEFPHFKEWPLNKKQLFLKQHKKRNDRLELFLFLWGNGMRPERAMYWVLWHNTYDRSAIEDVQGMVRKAYSRDPVFTSYPHWDLHLKRIVRNGL